MAEAAAEVISNSLGLVHHHNETVKEHPRVLASRGVKTAPGNLLMKDQGRDWDLAIGSSSSSSSVT